MANIRTTLCGIPIDSPFVVGSSPATFNADNMIKACKAGCGAVVTKTISRKGATNTTRHMVSPGVNSLINNEHGSDMPLEFWMEEIPKAKANGVKCLIASLSSKQEEAECIALGKSVQKAGADIIEMVADYHNPAGLQDRIKAFKDAVPMPLLVKVNANWSNTTEMAALCAEAGADGVTAIDSVGPTLRLDLATGKPMLGGKGFGYSTGAPILPISLRIVHEIASGAKEGQDIVGTGGVMSGRDALEMLLAGATCVGVATLPILRGLDIFEKLCAELSSVMDQYGYADIKSASGKSLRAGKLLETSVADFRFHAAQCTHCGRCEKVCMYGARKLSESDNVVDASLCRVCGLCFTACPTKAIFVDA